MPDEPTLTPELVELDIRGQICPSSLLMALREINARQAQIKRGTVRLLLMTDNRDATTTIPETARNMGYDVDVDKQRGYYRITIVCKAKSL
jgi:TusA-related sulfurtransferase